MEKTEEDLRALNVRNRRMHVRPKVLGTIRQAPFAGRIGGNQEFVALGDDEESEAILRRQPDAVRLDEAAVLDSIRANAIYVGANI